MYDPRLKARKRRPKKQLARERCLFLKGLGLLWRSDSEVLPRFAEKALKSTTQAGQPREANFVDKHRGRKQPRNQDGKILIVPPDPKYHRSGCRRFQRCSRWKTRLKQDVHEAMTSRKYASADIRLPKG